MKFIVIFMIAFVLCNGNVITEGFADFSSSFTEFMNEVEELKTGGTPHDEQRLTLDAIKQKIGNFEARLKDDFNEFAKRFLGQLAYATKKFQTNSDWAELSERCSKSTSITKEKLISLIKTFTDSIHYGIDSNDKFKKPAVGLKESWEHVSTELVGGYDKFTENFNKLTNKLIRHTTTEQTTDPILKCAGKEYTLVAFISLLGGSTIRDANIDIDSIEDWVSLANELKIRPCNSDLKWIAIEPGHTPETTQKVEL